MAQKLDISGRGGCSVVTLLHLTGCTPGNAIHTIKRSLRPKRISDIYSLYPGIISAVIGYHRFSGLLMTSIGMLKQCNIDIQKGRAMGPRAFYLYVTRFYVCTINM